MSGKKAKVARKEARASAPPVKGRARSGFWTSRNGGLVALGVVTLVAASFVLPGVLNKKTASAGAAHAMAIGAKQGEGLPAGSTVPSFSERDLLTGEPISSQTVYGHKTLLFFSEGVMCQACFQQIQGLQQVGAALHRRGIQLVSITPDSPGDLQQAARQYGITTPLIADADRNMSEAFNTLGLGMHADTPGHAFALIDHGNVLWYRDYWLPPYRSMYVEPKKLLADIPSA
jgi:peroxiredoxin Q/BCP